MHRRRSAFTLIELLVFVAIFAVVVGVFVTILVELVAVQSQQSVSSEVSQQGQYLLQQIQYYVENARLVDMPLDTPQSALTLRESNISTDPTIIYTPPSYVQSGEAISYDTTNVSVSLAKNVTAGDVFAVGVMWENSSTAITGITDTCGTGGGSDTYTILGSPVVGQYNDMQLAYAVIQNSGSCTITATLGASSPTRGRIEVFADEIAGVSLADPVDGGQYALNFQSDPGGTNAVTSGDINVGRAGDYLWGIAFNEGEDVGIPIAPGMGYAIGGSGTITETEYAVSADPGKVAATFTRGWTYGSFITGIIPFRPGVSTSPGNGTVYVEQGSAGIGEPLSSGKVTLSNLTFTRYYNLNSTSSPTGIESVAYSFTVSAGVGAHAYSQTFQSSANVTSPVPQIALLQQAKVENTNSAVSTLSLAYPGGNEKGDLLLATVGTANAVTPSMTDTAGNTWSLVESTTTFGGQVSIFAAPNASSSAVNTTTVTFGGGGATDPTLMLFEYRGAATSSPLDAWGAQAQAGNAAPTSPSVSPTSTVELLFGVDANAYPTTAVASPGTGFTLEASSTSGYTTQLFVEDQDQYVTGLVSAPWSFSVPASSTAMIATFK